MASLPHVKPFAKSSLCLGLGLGGDSVQLEGKRPHAHMANARQQKAFLLSGFRSFATGSLFRNAPAEGGRFIIQCKISTTRFGKATLSWGEGYN